MAPSKRCNVPKGDFAKTCCSECSFGRLTGESQGKEGCGSPSEGDVGPTTAMRQNIYYQCCLEAAEELESTTTEKPTTTTSTTTTTTSTTTTTTTEKPTTQTPTTPKPTTPKPTTPKPTTPKPTTLKPTTPKPTTEKPTTETPTTEAKVETTTEKKIEKEKYINECAEALDDLCTEEDTVCHNTEGSYKCVPIKKRDVGLSCPPGFQRNVVNQVCDDINECRLPRPPCPKYLCENTIGGYKCAGKPGKPFEEAPHSAAPTTEASGSTTPAVKNDICPTGFRAGADDECIDIDECDERLDDCQRLSQHCINTHGGYFCQDHVSKRCAPGFKVNSATGKCEDIDECEESSEVCKRTEVCVNLPGAYNCKSKISTLPKLVTKNCQEGTRVRPGGTICEDIDECREGTHLCDQFQNCINTFGGHECRCKNGFELDSSSSACVDIDECALKLDNCGAGQHCQNVLGSFTCTRRVVSTTTTIAPPIYEYEYYDSDEDNTTGTGVVKPEATPETTPSTTSTTTSTTTTTTTTPRPTTTSSTTTTTTTTPRPQPTRPRYPYYPRPPPTNRRPPYTNRPERPLPTLPTTPVTEATVPPRRPYTPKPPELPPYPVEVAVPTPTDTHTVERDRNPDGSYDINTRDIPKDRWTNVIGRETPETPENGEFDLKYLHCLNGYEKNAKGECVDIDECADGRYICSNLEVCQNRDGGYTCECIAGFIRDSSGWCVVSTTSTVTTPKTTTSTTRMTTTSSTTPKPTTRRTTTTSATTTEKPAPATPPEWTYIPTPRPRPRVRPDWPYSPPINCELGYTYSASQSKCVDIDECATNKASCSPTEDCVNTEGGYRCVCGRRCREEHDRLSYVPSREPSPPISRGDSNVITVGAQYGQRGTRYIRPTWRPGTGSLIPSCPWGYKLTPEKYCLDIDECALNTSECGPQQRCENFYGGYSCQCPSGHRLVGQYCEDIDECAYGNPCSYYARCVNTVGSYRCSCNEGFRNAPSNDKVCVDIDECSESSTQCQQGCSNAWGGYRCYCYSGYRLSADNRTCVDIDECAEWGNSRSRGRLCGGSCENVPGSYRCTCPSGYRLGDDARSCIDIDECETGEAQCGRPEEGNVCQNTRGGHHCHHIDCPNGYRLEGKHKCTRVQRACPISDWTCLQQPSTYSYNFITFVANIYLPMGSVDLFTMHGPSWHDSVVNFEMRMLRVRAAPGVRPADLSCFDMRPTGNVCVISLLCSLGGPQVAELELTMSLYQRAQFAGSAVARLIVIVSQYEF
ncbi:uncharacterized protein [Epargyreus clarus]|uniref:uncharacterized protein isoform X2 n=1 Tax=Epargyreus clarus TaxID=520877 RepID=UPI003C2C9A6A